MLISFSLPSTTLGLPVPVTVLRPDRAYGPLPVLYLLHGLSQDHTSWLRMTALEEFLRDFPLMVVMPSAFRTFYTDTWYGLRYFTFLSEELPACLAGLFQIRTGRAHTFLCGNSMGGYGALKWAFRCPDRFAAVASLSGALIQARMLPDRLRQKGEDDPIRKELQTVFGPTVRPEDDIVLLAENAADSPVTPALYLRCGTQDHFLPYHNAFAAQLTRLNYRVTAQADEAGHNWSYWNTCIEEVLSWLKAQQQL